MDGCHHHQPRRGAEDDTNPQKSDRLAVSCIGAAAAANPQRVSDSACIASAARLLLLCSGACKDRPGAVTRYFLTWVMEASDGYSTLHTESMVWLPAGRTVCTLIGGHATHLNMLHHTSTPHRGILLN